jgi:hypothetical protein
MAAIGAPASATTISSFTVSLAGLCLLDSGVLAIHPFWSDYRDSTGKIWMFNVGLAVGELGAAVQTLA